MFYFNLVYPDCLLGLPFLLCLLYEHSGYDGSYE